MGQNARPGQPPSTRQDSGLLTLACAACQIKDGLGIENRMTGSEAANSRIEAALSRIDAALERLDAAPAGNPEAETELVALRSLHNRVAARLDAAISRLDAAVESGE